MCPFSFDLRDSMQRVAQEQKLERLRLKLMEERHPVGYLFIFLFFVSTIKYLPTSFNMGLAFQLLFFLLFSFFVLSG